MPEKPLNILWISFEDCNPLYNCYGDMTAKTPNLNKLAAEGGVWKKAYSTAPVCSPARSAVITGMYPISIGTHHHRTSSGGGSYPTPSYSYGAVLPHYVKCIPEYFRAAGYYCTNCAKTDYQFAPPKTAWDECNNQAHWRNRPAPDQPFFSVFNLGRTHESGMWEDKDYELTVDPASVEVPPYFPDTQKVREAIARNYANIEHNDMLLGNLLEQLEDDGLADNTIVFHWSDHGPSVRGKRWPYEAGVHMPMIVRWPGHIEPGAVSEDLVSTIDLGPTILSCAGLTIPYHIQGQAFLGPKAAEPREYIYISRDRYDAMYDMVRACRDKRFKYMRHFQPENEYLLWNAYRNKHPIMQEIWRLHAEGKLEGDQLQMLRTERPAEELFDVDADPHELENLAEDPEYKEVLGRMRKALDDWRADVGDLGEIPEDIMFYQMYPGGVQPQTLTPALITLGPHALGDDKDNRIQDGEIEGPVLLQMQMGTQGSSIAYTMDEGENARWLLYTGPIRLPKGRTIVRSQAYRIGYRPSDEITGVFDVK